MMNTQTTPGPPGNEDQEQSWLQRPGENNLWFSRFSAYCALGPTRTKLAVYRDERARKGGNERDNSRTVPSSWNDAAKSFDWKRRTEAYDTWRRKEVFNTGNAKDTERIAKLNTIIEKLHEHVLAMLDKTLPDGRFNEKIFAQYLAALDLMARHTGGYSAVRVEHTGKDGKPIEVEETKLNVFWYIPQIDELVPNNGTLIEEVYDDTSDTTKDNQDA